MQRNKIFAVFLYCLVSILFWAIFAQMFSSVMLFTQCNIARDLFAWIIPAAMFTGLGPLFIFLLSPVLAWLWLNLGKKDIRLAVPYKFALSLVFIGLAFLVLKLSIIAASNGVTNPL